MTNRILTAASATFLLLSFPAVADEPKLEWVDEPGKHRTLMSDGKPVVRYMYEALDESTPERRQETYKPYLHVYSPDGETLLTKGPGGLFPHHRGIFYGFNKITYGDGKTCDTWHCKGKAYQSHEEFVECKTLGDRIGELQVRINWHGRDGEVFANELRSMSVVLRPSTDEESVLISFHSSLSTADGKPIHLDGDPQHAGVQFRASQHVAEKTKGKTYYLRIDGKGKPGETRNWNHTNSGDPMNEQCSNRPWNAMSFVVDGNRYTTVYLDHGDNPKPSRYSERDYGRFGSYFVADVENDKSVDVTYHFYVKSGESTLDECRRIHDSYGKQTANPGENSFFGTF